VWTATESSSLSFQLGLVQIAAPGHASCVYFIFFCCLNFEFLACWLVSLKLTEIDESPNKEIDHHQEAANEYNFFREHALHVYH
jgi:hypothetical protein